MKDNPFYNNYIFDRKDLERTAIKFWQYPLLFLLPTYVYFSDGYAFFYKRWDGKIYMMKYEKLEDTK